jgi:UDP-N-acetylglucosamine acyltransferase
MRAAGGYSAQLFGLNSVGLKRHGFSNERIVALRQAYEILFRAGHRMADAIKLTRDEFPDNPDVSDVLTFIEGTKRGVCRSTAQDMEMED